MKKSILTLALLSICFSAKSQDTDINGVLYKTISIGSKIWTAENLRSTKFQNGDTIPEAKSIEEWIIASEKGQPVFYNWNKTSNIETYGHLYNWYAIADKRGLAPKGYHIPTDNEWSDLAKELGGNDKATIKLKSITDWDEIIGAGSNESGFNALPAGKVFIDFQGEGAYTDKGLNAYFWSSTPPKDDFPLNRSLGENKFGFDEAESKKGNGLSVRCVKNK